jgi:hypothetical protein
MFHRCDSSSIDVPPMRLGTVVGEKGEVSFGPGPRVVLTGHLDTKPVSRGAAGSSQSKSRGPRPPVDLRHAPQLQDGHRRTADSLVATIATHSRLLVMPDAERAQLLDQIRA